MVDLYLYHGVRNFARNALGYLPKVKVWQDQDGEDYITFITEPLMIDRIICGLMDVGFSCDWEIDWRGLGVIKVWRCNQ